ncbi:MAG TPA: SRPBCC family protein [Candidatus Eisenbacteria bacterium]|nr:SRPBCC family protein [Candidatus Eisenbacteria bacterium]
MTVRALLLTALLLVPARPAAGSDVEAAEAAGAGDVTVQVTRGAAGLEVEGRCTVVAPVAIVWEVLTDYDGIDRFVSSMRESRVTERDEHHALVEQVAVGRLFLFSRKFQVTLFVEEFPDTTIRFADALGKDFESYVGEWRIEARPEGVGLVYQVGARPSFSIPDFLARGVFRRTARDLLAQVKTEIERRAALEANRVGAPAPVERERHGS